MMRFSIRRRLARTAKMAAETDRRLEGRASRARKARGDDGFVLLESIITISIITIIMTALASFFMTAIASTGQQRARSAAAQIADSTVANLRGRHASDLISGHDSASVAAQFSAALSTVQPWNATMLPAVDPKATTTGTGTTAAVPTVAQTSTINSISYGTYTYLGWCWILTTGTDTSCSNANMPTGWTNSSTVRYTSATQYLRAVVAVTWHDGHCRVSTCSYVTSTLLNATDDPTFQLNATPPPVPVISATPDQTNAVGDVVDLNLAIISGTGVPKFIFNTASTLPAGLAWNSAGEITGTPDISASGTTKTITFTVTDAFGRTSASDTFTWTILPKLVLTSSLPDRADKTGTAITQVSLAATGGTGSGYTWSATGLPPGISLSSNKINGTPTTPGVYNTSVTVTDSSGSRTASIPFTWTISYPDVAAVTPSTQTDTINTAISGLQLSANGGSGSYTYSLVTAAPAGITLSASGKFTGTPTALGTTSVTVNVNDAAAGQSRQVTFSWVVVAKPSVPTPATVNTTLTGTPSGNVSASCPNSPCTFALNNGPTGMTISAVTSAGVTTGAVFGGTVGGSAGSYGSASITITDADGATTTSSAFTIVVNPVPSLTNPGNQYATKSVADSFALSPFVIAGTGPYTYSASPLPAGLALNTATGIISGTPLSTAVTTTVTARVTDSQNVASATVSFKYYISNIGWNTIPAQTSAKGTTFTTSNGLLAATYLTGTPTSGSYTATGLPTGLVIDANTGRVTGTITRPGTYSVTISAKDNTTPTAVTIPNNPFVWTVAGPTITANAATPWPITTSRNATPSQRFNYTCSTATCTVTLTGPPPTGIGLSTTTPVGSANATTTLSNLSGSGTIYLAGLVSSGAAQKTYTGITLTIKDGNNVTDVETGSWTVA